MKAAIPYTFSGALLIAADQAVKGWVEARLPFEQAVPIAPFLSLYRTWNQGISFSLLSGLGPAALIALALAVTAFVLALAWKSKAGETFARAGYALIIAGALGNLIDRAAYGHVVDYILFHTQNWAFSVFNLADAYISVGAALVVLQEILSIRRDRASSD